MECKNLQKLTHSKQECIMQDIHLEGKLNFIYKDIAIAFLISLLFLLPLGIYLAKLSLRPIQDAIELMDNFVNGIVHDINTPLSIISVNTQSLQKKLTDAKLRKRTERILQGIEHIENLEEEMLFMLRIHHYELKKNYFDLFTILEEREAYYNDINSNIRVIVEGEACSIYADQTALIRAIDNIVINAIKYSKANSDVRIVCKNHILSIKDEGEGIKNPQEVFNKYYRESTTTKGLGLGLYVVQLITSMHHIPITLHSKVGKGSEFILDLHPTTHKLHT